MSDNINDYNNDNLTSAKKPTNTDLIYSYTQELRKLQNESLNRLDTKMSVFFAFTGVLVRFASDLSEKVIIQDFVCYSCLLLQVITYMALGSSALILCLGLTTKLRGSVISPKALMKDRWYFADKNDISDYIISGWVQAEEEYEKLGFEKGRKLNIAVWLIALSLICITINNILIKILWPN
ncbi:MAG: hypothetical protein WBM32_07845 [Crocosphaera sp.]